MLKLAIILLLCANQYWRATTVALKKRSDGLVKQSGQHREKHKFTSEDLPAAVRPEFRGSGAVLINAKRLAALQLEPFGNPSADHLQPAVDAVFPDSDIRLSKGEPYYENVSRHSPLNTSGTLLKSVLDPL